MLKAARDIIGEEGSDWGGGEHVYGKGRTLREKVNMSENWGMVVRVVMEHETFEERKVKMHQTCLRDGR